MKVRTVVSAFLAVAFIVAIPPVIFAQRPNSLYTRGTKTNVTEAQVCAADFEASIKPIPSGARREMLSSYGKDPSSYTGEVDRLIPASLGGSNKADNLWPMPDNKEYGIAAKRELEKTLHQMVCDKKITLKAAQDAIRKDWVKAYDEYVKK